MREVQKSRFSLMKMLINKLQNKSNHPNNKSLKKREVAVQTKNKHNLQMKIRKILQQTPLKKSVWKN